MCGIIGAAGNENVVSTLISGLELMEYRGYDSAGCAVIDKNNDIDSVKSLGKIVSLKEKLQLKKLNGNIGIAHTRWATHGVPSEVNAHPLISNNEVAVVHNGIIENYLELKKKLEQDGFKFVSQTDTEIIAHLFDQLLIKYSDPYKVITEMQKKLQGSYAVGILTKKYPDRFFAIRQGSPLVIGIGDKINYISSDQLALIEKTNSFIFLEDGDFAEIFSNKINIFDNAGNKVERKINKSSLKFYGDAELGNFRHYMQKEIFEQPKVIRDNVKEYLLNNNIKQNIISQDILVKTKFVQMVACGTSFHSALIAKDWIEKYIKIPCFVDIASEFRSKDPIVLDNSIFISVSQSGETADTLSALKKIKDKNYLATIAICNVPGSSLTRESDFTVLTNAGVEIGVASTKAFMAQLFSFLIILSELANSHKIKNQDIDNLSTELLGLANLLESALELDKDISKIAVDFVEKNNALFLGRGTMRYVSYEGALKLKEVSYIHAEAYAGGELKHGPLALVDKNMPIVAVAPEDDNFTRMMSNLSEVAARDGKIYLFTDNFQLEKSGYTIIKMPKCSEILSPLVYSVPLQLLSYHVAVLRGTDVDKPRNLAKSVTVE